MTPVVRAAAVLCALLSTVGAQTPTGRITGVVTDASGAVIPGVRVEAVNSSTGIQAAGKTNQSGIYQLTFLNPGRYVVKASAEGFQGYVRENVVVETGALLTLDIALQLGAAAESITVSAETPLLQPDRASVNQVVERASVANIPIGSRRVGALLRVLGTVTYIGEDLTFGWADLAVAGGRGRQQNWSLDGGTVHGVPMYTGVANANPPMEAIEEVRVESSNYPAEYGRTTGGYIVMTTRGGTNQFHGSAYEFLRNDAFDARSFFAPSVAPRKYNVFGGTIGGPVIRNKMHFFASYEGTRRRDGATRTYGVPTPAEVSGDFSAAAGTGPLDPLTRLPFPNKMIPASRLDPAGVGLAKLYPAPNVPGAASGANNFRVNAVTRQTGDNYLGRVDYAIGAMDRLMVRYIRFRGRNVPGTAFALPESDPNYNVTDVKSANLTPAWMHTFSPRLTSETRASLLWRSEDTPRPDMSGVAGKLGISGVNPNGMPRVSILNYSALGNSNQGRFIGPFRSTQITQSFTYFRGKHTLKFGGEGRRNAVTDNYLTARSGSFTYNDVATGRGYALPALLLGWTQRAQVIAGNMSPRMKYFGLFVQDDWKVSSRLTFNLGLRWEMDTPWEEGFGRRSGFDPLAMNPVSKTPGDVVWADLNNLSKYAHSFDKNNLGPRFGFGWRPFGERTVVRGGYGLIYGGIYDGSMARIFDVGFADQRDFVSPDNGLTPAVLLRNGVPTPPPAPRGPGYGAVPVGGAVYLTPDYVLANQVNPYSHQANFTVQREFLNSWMLETGWIANLSHKIPGRDVNVNEIRPELRGARQDQRLRPFPQYSGVTLRNPSWGNSSYHAWNTRIQKRFSNGFSLLSNYTWSKFLDDVQATTEALSSGPQTYYARQLDKSVSGNDVRHRFNTSLVYELPVGKGKRLAPGGILGLIAGDWSLSGYFELRGGFPFGIVEQSNRLNAFTPRQRSSVAGEWKIEGQRSRSEMIQRYFNTAAFVFPGDGVLGNTARAFITGPGITYVDTSLFKTFFLNEQWKVQLRGEFYNSLNTPFFSNPNTSRGSTAFGQIGGASGARFVQIAARLEF